jgi:predicted Fe-Mo cluster-binding NifX family protein
MKIAVTAEGTSLSSKVDRSFGRARWFVVIDVENETHDGHSNAQNLDAAQGAGIQAARNVADLGVEAILTGNVGPKAFRTLMAASIKIFVFDKSVSTVSEALAEWKSGHLKEIDDATVESHWI